VATRDSVEWKSSEIVVQLTAGQLTMSVEIVSLPHHLIQQQQQLMMTWLVVETTLGAVSACRLLSCLSVNN